MGQKIAALVPAIIVYDLGSAFDCGFNGSLQHLNSHYREGDVENETKTKDLLLRITEGIDVGSLAERRIHERDRPTI